MRHALKYVISYTSRFKIRHIGVGFLYLVRQALKYVIPYASRFKIRLILYVTL